MASFAAATSRSSSGSSSSKHRDSDYSGYAEYQPQKPTDEEIEYNLKFGYNISSKNNITGFSVTNVTNKLNENLKILQKKINEILNTRIPLISITRESARINKIRDQLLGLLKQYLQRSPDMNLLKQINIILVDFIDCKDSLHDSRCNDLFYSYRDKYLSMFPELQYAISNVLMNYNEIMYQQYLQQQRQYPQQKRFGGKINKKSKKNTRKIKGGLFYNRASNIGNDNITQTYCCKKKDSIINKYIETNMFDHNATGGDNIGTTCSPLKYGFCSERSPFKFRCFDDSKTDKDDDGTVKVIAERGTNKCEYITPILNKIIAKPIAIMSQLPYAGYQAVTDYQSFKKNAIDVKNRLINTNQNIDNSNSNIANIGGKINKKSKKNTRKYKKNTRKYKKNRKI